MTLNEFCRAHDLVLNETETGMALAADGGARPVTVTFPTVVALEIEARDHAAAIVEAARLTTPSQALVDRYRGKIAESRTELSDYLDNTVADLGRTEDDVASVREAVRRHRAEHERLLGLAGEAPCRLFLPLGTVVRLKADFADPEWWVWRRPASVIPVAGTLGVVTENAPGGDADVVVRFPDGQRLADGSVHMPSDDSDPHGKYFAVGDLDVVSHSVTLDGHEWLSPEFAATHRYTDEAVEDGGHMNLLVSGFERGPMVLSIGDGGESSFYDEGYFRDEIESDLVMVESEERGMETVKS